VLAAARIGESPRSDVARPRQSHSQRDGVRLTEIPIRPDR